MTYAKDTGQLQSTKRQTCSGHTAASVAEYRSCYGVSVVSVLRKHQKQARRASVPGAMRRRISRGTATCSNAVRVDLRATAMWSELQTSCRIWLMPMVISPEKGRWRGLWTRGRAVSREDTAMCLVSSGTTTAGDSVVTQPKRSPQTRVPVRGVLPQSQDRPESPTGESPGFSRGRMSSAVSPVEISSRPIWQPAPPLRLICRIIL